MSDRVYCTADGECPNSAQTVIFEGEDNYGCCIGGFDGHCWCEQDGYILYENNEKIYWKPLTTLKDEYERQKDGE